MTDYDLAVDFMDMTNDRHLWTHLEGARPGFAPVADRYVVVGDADAIPAVAKILPVNHEGHIELEVLPGATNAALDTIATLTHTDPTQQNGKPA